MASLDDETLAKELEGIKSYWDGTVSGDPKILKSIQEEFHPDAVKAFFVNPGARLPKNWKDIQSCIYRAVVQDIRESGVDYDNIPERHQRKLFRQFSFDERLKATLDRAYLEQIDENEERCRRGEYFTPAPPSPEFIEELTLKGELKRAQEKYGL